MTVGEDDDHRELIEEDSEDNSWGYFVAGFIGLVTILIYLTYYIITKL